MSKDRGSKNVKKAPAEGGKKAESDYQSGKKSIGGNDLKPIKKK
ncbi:hypothetical protein C8P68_10165 [Mucilaginibacter yixingensis]|uniref:Uncharacterized protein n=1 Tax=Mucilaginibacter yixingensis TaxID=1295612 RepID=A0A2T5JEH1_9SPHI|nr:hypothetical protein [Mucilaginibacter yixingensis]PTR00837.1 hypothetical protein C8P68_10165 [Mucilaginibacter yixingensis]